jgi:hypothetical protein
VGVFRWARLRNVGAVDTREAGVEAARIGVSRRALIGVSVACFTAATALSAAGVAADAERAAPLKRIIGTNKADRFRGTAKADFIDGRAGNDVLYGLAGNDRLRGGSGADRIVCGRGRDTVAADLRDTVARDCEVVRGGLPPPPVVPEQLLGTWNRYIDETTAIDANHVANHVGIWSITFLRTGVSLVDEPEGAHGPGRFRLYGTFSATADGELVLAPGYGCTTNGIYQWEIADAILRIQKVTDVCFPRAAVIWGDWSR